MRDCHCSYACRSYSAPAEMEAEHCFMSGHDTKFECSSHYENLVSLDPSNPTEPKTSAREEWDAVVKGEVPASMIHFRLRECYRKLATDANGRIVRVYKDYTAPDSDIL